MNASAQPRIPAGAPKSAGGQWAAATRREAAVDLSEDREAALASGEPVPAIFTTGDRVSERADRWWDTQASIAEWAGEGAAFPKMPGDWTPRRTVGTADSGLRRTHRMTYSGNGFSLRMPSATSIRSFSAAGRGAFDVPVDAVDERGRAITAWIRAVQHKPGHWSVSGLGFGGVTDAKVSEAVASVLESRRPTRALRQAGDLIEKHRQRLADRGEELQRVRSSWIAAVGYSDVDRILLMQTRAGANPRGDHVPSRTYGTHVSRESFVVLERFDEEMLEARFQVRRHLDQRGFTDNRRRRRDNQVRPITEELLQPGLLFRGERLTSQFANRRQFFFER